MYAYRGSNPNNYVTFNEELWRIISVNTSDNTIKIMRNDVLSDRKYDDVAKRYSSGGYCNDDGYGCNIWGSSSTLYDSNLSPITTLAREVGKTAYTLLTSEADLNTYLNDEYYKGLNSTVQRMITEGIYKVGVLNNQSGQKINVDISQVNAVKWKGKVALIDATEFVRVSINSSCDSVYSSTYSGGTNCGILNWMLFDEIYWTMSPFSDTYSSYVFYVDAAGRLYDGFGDANNLYGVRPIVTLSSEVQITGGTGSSSDPYILEI